MRGDVVSAIALYRDIIGADPHQADALHGMGLAAYQAGKPENALLLIEGALKERPDFARAWYNRSLILRGVGRAADALDSVRKAVESDANLAEAWNMLGQMEKDRGAYAEAGDCYQRAIALQPANAHFHGNLASLLFAAGDLVNAHRAARNAEKADPDWPPLTLGNILKNAGYPEQAAAQFARTRALQPHFAEAAGSEAIARLQSGDMERGWSLWEQRPDLAAELAALPFWQGQKTGTLLVYEDQGLGDALHFARYLPALRARVERLVLRLKPALLRLFAENFPDIGCVSTDEPAPAAEARCRLSSLPFFFATRPDSIPPAPYLIANIARRALWQGKLRGMQGPRIGIAWAGNGHFRNDAARSIPFAQAATLFDAGRGHLVSLQKGREPVDFFDAAPQLEDFADTAALIAELDLVISVDTATAHLAGALGKPVFIALPFDADWRWLLGREDSPWYPAARLFRQTYPGDWAPVLARLADALQKFIGGDKSVLQATPHSGENLRQNTHAIHLPA
ncbi:MAG: tetratricopeptide repeat protein [Alphaproteobacteria bacterium]|nr:tetratricopeptide repeat protein [Alphaproteobacteria bacterium]